MIPDGLDVTLRHCGELMAAGGGSVGWSGEYELTRQDYRCRSCGLKVEIAAEAYVGSPGMVTLVPGSGM